MNINNVDLTDLCQHRWITLLQGFHQAQEMQVHHVRQLGSEKPQKKEMFLITYVYMYLNLTLLILTNMTW